jgi:transposase-like protein
LDTTLCARIRETLEPLRSASGRSWRVDETYVKIKGRWTYLYPAVDKEGRTVDFPLRAKRDVAAAKAFFRLAFRRQGRLPLKITLDGYQASHPEGNQCKIRSSKYLNNLIEQDHRSVKLRLGPMLGLKSPQPKERQLCQPRGIDDHLCRKGPKSPIEWPSQLPRREGRFH